MTLTACDDVYGQEFTISRIFREAPNVYLDGKLQPGVSIRETVLRRPIYFGQKDLSSTGEGFETDLVEKLVGEKLRMLRDEIETQRQHVRDAASRWLKLSNTAELRRDHESQLTDANFRLKKFEEYGVADKLQKRLGYQQDATALTRMKDRADSFVIALGQLISEHEDDLRNATSYVSKQNPGFFTAYYAEFANLVAKVDQLKKIEQEARAITARLQAKQGEFDDARQSLQEEFAQVERQLAQELKQTGMTAIQPDDFLTQQQRKTKAEQMLEALAKQETQQSSIRDAAVCRDRQAQRAVAARVQRHQGRTGSRERRPHRPADRSRLQGRQGSRHRLHAAALQGQQHPRNHPARRDGGLRRFRWPAA